MPTDTAIFQLSGIGLERLRVLARYNDHTLEEELGHQVALAYEALLEADPSAAE